MIKSFTHSATKLTLKKMFVDDVLMFECLLPFTLSAAPLQTLLLGLKVVAVASAASIVESLAPLGGGVVKEAQLEGVARPDVHLRRAGLCTQSDRL